SSHRRLKLSPKDLVSDYLARVRAKEGWESLLSDELRVTNFTHPVQRVAGKQGSIEGIRRFYSMVTALEFERIIADGKQLRALTRYEDRKSVGWGSGVGHGHRVA